MWSRTQLAVDSQLRKKENGREMDGVREGEREGDRRMGEREGRRKEQKEFFMMKTATCTCTLASTYLLFQFGSHLL